MNTPSRVTRPVRDLKIRAGELVMCAGVLSRIVICEGPDRIYVKTEGTSNHQWVGIGDLSPYVAEPPRGKIRHVVSSDPLQEQLAREWVHELRAAAKLHGRRLPNGLAIGIAKRMSVSLKTVRRRWRLYQANPLPAAQVPSMPGPAPKSRLLPPVVESLVSTAIDEVFLAREQGSVAAVKRRCDELASKAKVRPPSYQAINVRIKARDPLRVAIKRLGSDEAYAQQAPSIRGLETSHPLEVVQIDHALIDLIVVSSLSRQVIGRPWVTVAIDVYTRCVVGYYMSFDAPDQTSVALTMEHSCLPKDRWLRAIGLEGKVSYPVFGKMQRVAWDNAKTFQTKALLAQCERYGIEVRPRPVRRPHYGAYIERYIGSMMGAVHLLPGTTFSNSKARGNYPSEGKAMMTLPELEQWLALQIAGVYHNKPHAGLGGRTPRQLWDESWKNKDGSMRFPPIVGDPREFSLGFLPVANRRIGRGGIQLHSLRYWDPALTPFINDGIEHQVHYSQRDLTKIYLRIEDGYVDVPLLDRSRDAFSFWELRELRQYHREQGKKAVSESELFSALEHQREILRDAAKTSKAARRKLEKVPKSHGNVRTTEELDYAAVADPVPASEGVVK